MTHLLFPGRHHLLTNFQLEYLTRVTQGDPLALIDVNGQRIELAEPIDTIVWAVTSANHSNTRRNPLPANRREVAIEEFSTQLDVHCLVYLIDDIGSTDRFAEYVIKKIDVDSQGIVRLTPNNALVASSTPEVIEQYERLGFRVLPMELLDRNQRTFCTDPPWEVLNKWIASGLEGNDWRTNHDYLAKAARATRRLYRKYQLGDRIIDLHRSPLLTEDGDLTETRDYNTYVRSFDDGAGRKVELIKNLVQPGRIVDIGCCTGALIRELTLDPHLRESDFYGIEVARQLYTECLHRKEQGLFGTENVFFYQKDFASGLVFAENSVNTFTTFALTHEIESYGGRNALIRFIDLLRQQLTLQGRWLNVDVVGPSNRTEPILMRLNRDDGRIDDWNKPFEAHQRHEFSEYLEGLSTYARFLRFAKDFRHEEGYQLPYQEQKVQGESFVALSMQDACEFLSKKDYTDNWVSEMHETFCYWSYAEWVTAVKDAGFRVSNASREFTNPWIVQNRYQGKAELYRMIGGNLESIPYPVTNMVLVAEKT